VAGFNKALVLYGARCYARHYGHTKVLQSMGRLRRVPSSLFGGS
jgi:hypothetical protein